MKLSKHTQSVLQNFSRIQESIVLHPGNQLVTISEADTIVAMSEIPETIPMKVGIHDLTKFLGVLSLHPDFEIEFKNEYMLLTHEHTKIKYTYAEVSLIKTLEKKIVLPSIDLSFSLTAKQIEEVTKAMHVFKFSDIVFVTEDGKLFLNTLSIRNDSSDVFSTEICEVDPSLDISVVVEADKLKMLPLDYNVEICFSGLIHFRNETVPIDYWIAPSIKSKY